LMLVDVEQNLELIEVELAATVNAFCQDNPDHPECLVPPIDHDHDDILAELDSLKERVSLLEQFWNSVITFFGGQPIIN